MIGLVSKPALSRFLQTWSIILAASCAGMVAVVIGVLWVTSGFHGLGLSPTLAIALIVGAIGVTALGVLLMGLVFYSDTARIDDAIGRESISEQEPDSSSAKGARR